MIRLTAFSALFLGSLVGASLASAAGAADQTPSARQCVDLSGTYRGYSGSTLIERVIVQPPGCNTISITKKMVMPVWNQKKNAMVDSVFEVLDYVMTPEHTLTTIDMELTATAFAAKSKQQSLAPDMQTRIPVFQSTEFSLNQNGDLVETWRTQDRRPGADYNKDLVAPSKIPVLKRVR